MKYNKNKLDEIFELIIRLDKTTAMVVMLILFYMLTSDSWEGEK